MKKKISIGHAWDNLNLILSIQFQDGLRMVFRKGRNSISDSQWMRVMALFKPVVNNAGYFWDGKEEGYLFQHGQLIEMFLHSCNLCLQLCSKFE